jgi:hypothetical protein
VPHTRLSTQDLDPVPTPLAPRQAWVELACLLCGEMVGILLDRRVIRPRATGSVRIDEHTMRCGRCGCPVVIGERGDDALRDLSGLGR